MKKTILAIAAAMMMSATTMAQDDNKRAREPRKMDRTEMIRRHTDHVVKEYGLNEEQARQLLALNTEYAGKLPMAGRQRGGMRGPRGGQRGLRMEDGPQRPDSAGRDVAREQAGERQRPSREEMEKTMNAYNESLQKIMTADQYKRYKDNEAKRLKEGRGVGGRRGERPQPAGSLSD